MLNTQRMTRVLALLAGLAAFPAFADGPTFSLGGAGLFQLDSAKAITNSTAGFSITGSADWKTKNDYTVRTGIAINLLPGKAMGFHTDAYGDPRTDNGVKTELTGFQVYGDFHIPSGTNGLNFVLGLSLQKWNYKSSGPAGSVNPLLAVGDSANSSGSFNNYKFGLRAGLDYRFNSKWSGELIYQQTELGSNGAEQRGSPSEVPYYTNENPGWVQVGVRFHF